MYSKILMATDGSPTAAKAVERGAALARDTGASLILLYVGTNDDGNPILEQTKERLDGLDVDTRALPGDPADVICRVAESEGVDLIVVGNKGMADIKRFILGNVPNQVSHHAPCNVLIVKTT